MNCKWCHVEQEDENYLFCSIAHRDLYIYFIEKRHKTMKHPFAASQLDKTKCAQCKRDLFAHLNKATCESCGSNTGPCDLFDDILMCEKCENEYQTNMKNSIKEVETELSSVLERAKQLDSNIRVSGDYFNAQTIATNDVKRAILEDNNIPEDKKMYVFSKFIAERFEHMQTIINDADQKKHEATMAQLSLAKDARALGNDFRAEFREKLRLSDANYAPIKPLPAPKVKKVAIDPFERMAMNYQINMAHKNIQITLEEARETLRKNMKG